MVVRRQRPTPFGEPLWWSPWWGLVMGWLGFSSQAGVIDRAFLQPVWMPRPATVSKVVMNRSGAGGAATNLRLGFYADNGGTPEGGALLDTSGDIAADGPAVVTWTLSSALELPRGISWIALTTEDALIDYNRPTTNNMFIEETGENMKGCSYQVASSVVFDDPCPAVTTRNEARFICNIRVDKWRG